VPADSARLHHNLNHISCYHGHCHQNLIQIFLHHMNSALIQSSLTDIAYIKFFGHNQIFTLSPYLKLLTCDNTTNICGTITLSASENLATLFSQAAKYFQHYSTVLRSTATQLQEWRKHLSAWLNVNLL
jgi:hypothetical protein